MTQFYSDKSRESEPHALPDMEVFFVHKGEFLYAISGTWQVEIFERITCDSWADESTESAKIDAAKTLQGWYWWSCFPGCLPDGDPVGPFYSEQAAIEDARDG